MEVQPSTARHADHVAWPLGTLCAVLPSDFSGVYRAVTALDRWNAAVVGHAPDGRLIVELEGCSGTSNARRTVAARELHTRSTLSRTQQKLSLIHI